MEEACGGDGVDQEAWVDKKWLRCWQMRRILLNAGKDAERYTLLSLISNRLATSLTDGRQEDSSLQNEKYLGSFRSICLVSVLGKRLEYLVKV